MINLTYKWIVTVRQAKPWLINMIIFSCLMLEIDIDEIKKAGYVLTTPIIVTNTDEYLDVLEMKKENVEFGDELITIVK